MNGLNNLKRNKMKYKLINSVTKIETICDKVTIDGFDYYVNDEKLKVKDKFYFEIDGVSDILEVESEFHLERMSGHLDNKKVIATNNPNIDIPKVVDEVEQLALSYEMSFTDDDGTTKVDFKAGYNKSQETHPFSDEDMIEFADWISKEFNISNGIGWWHSHESIEDISTKELLQLWKEQKPKIVYY
jgi:hypothetical protein